MREYFENFDTPPLGFNENPNGGRKLKKIESLIY
jgi:hypothetical protein